MSILEQLQTAIEEGHPGECEALTVQALAEKIPAEQIVEAAMMPAMRRVGEQFKNQEADILRILAAARSIRKGYALLEQSDQTIDSKCIGTVILGTVEGDLHDVGKNLVAIMFRSAGFRVIDLGVDISEKQFLQAVESNPDVSIVCVSSLLSTAIPQMEHVVRSLRRKDPEKRYKIMVGGGALTRQLAEDMGADAYTETCVEAAEVAKTFLV